MKTSGLQRGITSTIGVFTYTVTVTDANAITATQGYTVTVSINKLNKNEKIVLWSSGNRLIPDYAGLTDTYNSDFVPISTSYTVSADVSVSQLDGGLLTIASGTCTLTLPIATDIITQLGIELGETKDFILQNSASGGTATIAVNTGIVAASAVTGGITLTLDNSATVGVGKFTITRVGSTALMLSRIY